MNKITVFYDGKCSLCAREIAHYQKIATQDKFYFCDITQDSKQFTQLGFETTSGLRQLHVLNSHGHVKIGLDAFITIWRELKGWKYLAMIANLPGIHFILSRVYKSFATWRFKKNGYDQCSWQ
jgi:predicted DCC family thiol-disulfide oxidoreductase YuxK